MEGDCRISSPSPWVAAAAAAAAGGDGRRERRVAARG
jgi:hypothetical protein